MVEYGIQYLFPNNFENKTLAMTELIDRIKTQSKSSLIFSSRRKYLKHTLNPLILTAFSYEYYY